MAGPNTDLNWSAQLAVSSSSRRSLPGDKIILPPSALEALLAAATSTAAVEENDDLGPSTSTFDPFNPYSFAAERAARAHVRATQQQQGHQQLPHPLTFRLVNPANGRVVYAGIREFSAEEGEVELSLFLRQALGLENFDNEHGATANGHGKSAQITVHARQLPKGTLVRLRPLEAGYDAEDWKSLLEQHLRINFTTMTNGEVLTIPGSSVAGGAPDYKFLIDKLEPSGDGICIVDTDLEVEIEPLNEEQARDTLQRRLAKSNGKPITGASLGSTSSPGGTLEIGQAQQGQVQEGAYVDYKITNWDRSKGIEFELGGVDDGAEVDIFVSPFSARQRAAARDDEHVWGDFSGRYPKRIRISPTNVELESAEALLIAVHAYAEPSSCENEKKREEGKMMGFYIQASTDAAEPGTTNGVSASHVEESIAPGADEVQCKNCKQWVPKRTMMLHENFCFRNNVLCPRCGNVYKKNSTEWSDHWDCPHDDAYGNTPLSRTKHEDVAHTPRACRGCAYQARNLPELAQHRTSTCPSKLIICRFCHLLVTQGGSNADADPTNDDPSAFLLSDLTPHEYLDGARTTECHICDKIVRLRDMSVHLRHHDLERRTKSRPRLCRNVNCGRTLQGIPSSSNAGGAAAEGFDTYGLCKYCYGPLYVSMYDPEGKALRRRVERRYLSQLLTGCGASWCRNLYCKTGHARAVTSPSPLASTSTATATNPLPPSSSPASSLTGATTTTASHPQTQQPPPPPTKLPSSTKEASELVKPFVENFTKYNARGHPTTTAATQGNDRTQTWPVHFCVDQLRQKRRMLAEILASLSATNDDPHGKAAQLVGPQPEKSRRGAAEGEGESEAAEKEAKMKEKKKEKKKGYALEWCVAALEATTSSSSFTSSSSSAGSLALTPGRGFDDGRDLGDDSDGGGKAFADEIEKAWQWLVERAPTLEEERDG